MRRARLIPTATALAAVLLGGCGAAAQTSSYATLRPACGHGELWHEGRCQAPGAADKAIDKGIELIESARFAEGLAEIERARSLGPHLHATFVRLHEQLGLARAYVNAVAKARAAFRVMLASAPDHQVSYDTSPTALFELEKVRVEAATEPRTKIDVRLPSDLNVEKPVPIDVEVLGDPLALLARATLLVSSREQPTLRAVDIKLPAVGERTRVVLPPTGSGKPDMLRLSLVGYDDSGNQVLWWESRERPREVSLAFTPRIPWYKKWWVWVTVGSVVAIGSGVVVYAVTREPPDLSGGTFGGAVTFGAMR